MATEIEKVQKALGEPVMAELSGYARRLRNNVLLISIATAALTLGGLELDSSSSILGLKFKNLDIKSLFLGLFIINAYMLIHFLWVSIDAFQEWSLRVSGTKLAFITTARLSSQYGDYPSDPRQSSLYQWWHTEASSIGSLSQPLVELESKLETLEKEVRKGLSDNGEHPMNITNSCNSIARLSDGVQKLQRSVDTAAKTIGSQRIPVSLERYDSRFKLFLKTQNLRWLVLELGLPIIMGFVAVGLLSSQL
ncbi:MAG: hypothetical protein HRU06_07260 [Oceanospirillaceae bacterium]|nr:hypothetical protein [Oceanospirillaceae bacterium]